MESVMKLVAGVLHSHIEKVVKPLLQRIEALEARPTLRYRGCWTSGAAYLQVISRRALWRRRVAISTTNG